MAYRKRNSSRVVIILIVVILAVHVLFPEKLKSVSQKLFGWYYEKYSIAEDIKIQSNKEENESLVLFPIAYPPQTPYDVVLVKNTQESIEVTLPQYVHTEEGNVVGYIQDSKDHLYQITLFSSPLSKETFSIGEFLAEGRGIGSGAILLEIPKEIEVQQGEIIRHLDSGKEAAYIFSIEEEQSRDIKNVHAILFENPLYINAYYIDENSTARTEDSSKNALINKIEALQEGEQQDAVIEKVEKEEEVIEEEVVDETPEPEENLEEE